MLFASRDVPSLARRVRLLVWPRVSFARSARYAIKRTLRVKASPHKIAIGCAAGVFASITPLIGVQMAMAALIAVILRGSLVAAMLATFVGNPLSWPIIWGATYMLGVAILGNFGAAEAASLTPGSDPVWPILYPMLIGSIPIGLAVAALSYGIVARSVELAQRDGAGLDLAAVKQRFGFGEPTWRLW
jgi:uncharacterized protein